MKTTKFLTLVILALMAFAVSAQAQKKTTKKSTTPKTTPATTTATSAEIRAGAEKVSVQLNNVAVFNYRLGGIATGLEDMDAAARKTPLREPTLSKHKANKQAVVQGIRNLRAGLAALEVEFRTKLSLKRFQFQIGGIADLVGQSEELAGGGQFTEAGKVLLQVIQKLSDTLVAMP
jgi:hypothetical protein